MNRAAALSPVLTLERALGAGVLVIALLAPLIFTSFFVSFVLTQTLWLGIAAASLIFLSAYGNMVSLAQVSLYGIAGFTLGNVVTTGETKGLNLGWDPWLGVVLGIAIATGVGLVFGAVASRSTGIYFLMITLTFSVIANYFFGQVETFSGFGGISNIDSYIPGVIGTDRNRLYYTALGVAIVVYLLIRYIVRTPFGLSLQGIRDDAVRMSSLGYGIALHRTLAFGFAAFIASLAGVLFVWWNGHVDPASIDLTATIDLLIVAVIGGLFRLEGAWLGAFAFVLINNYIRDIAPDWTIGIPGGVDLLRLDEARFHTVIGVVFLIIVLLSPGGLMGIWEAIKARLRTRAPVLRRRPAEPAATTEKTGVT